MVCLSMVGGVCVCADVGGDVANVGVAEARTTVTCGCLA